MNILTFNYEYPPIGGGGGVIHALIAEELARRHLVSVVTSAYSGRGEQHERVNGVEVYRVPVLGRTDRNVATMRSLFSYLPAAVLQGLRLVRRCPFDVVNGHFALPTGPASISVARLAGLPHVISLHGGDIFDPSKKLSPHRHRLFRWAVAGVLNGSDCVVAQSTNTRDNVYRYHRYKGAIEIIPHGIRIPDVPRASRDELGLPPDVFLTVTVGRLIERKAIHELVQTLAAEPCANVHLAVVGAGPLEKALRELVARLGFEERVHFMGFVDENTKWRILSVSDAYVSSTMHEGFGLVYLEAMAAGLPVVTYGNGGQADFLIDGSTGFLVSAGNREALASAIGRLAAVPEEARRMGEANRARADGYRIERCAAMYESLFEKLAISARSKLTVAKGAVR